MSPTPVTWVEALLRRAVEAGASDVHLTPGSRGPRAVLRMDGRLVTVGDDPELPYDEVVSRLKVLAGCNLAQRLVPQDGAFVLSVGGRDVECRLSVVPAATGDSVVVRLLDRGRRRPGLDALGLGAAEREQLRRLCRRPSGLVLVAGPVGAGKTTTLYALVEELAAEGLRVVTVEDPVEGRVEGAVQVAVNERSGLSFAVGLRAVVRHDPDVVVVGEIRDGETARAAVEAAGVGHLVLATMHAGSVRGALERVAHLSGDRHRAASAVSVVVCQRLLRSRTGGGRQAVFHVWEPDGEARRQVMAGTWDGGDEDEGLAEAAVTLLAQGMTTAEEVLRVLGPGRGAQAAPPDDGEARTRWLDSRGTVRALAVLRQGARRTGTGR